MTLNPGALLVLVVATCLYCFVVRRLTFKRRLAFVAALVVLMAVVSAAVAHSKRYVPAALSINADSARLTRTQIVPTLDTPVEPGKNVIWCASFVGAWKELETLANGPVLVSGADEVCARLDAAADPRPTIPPECYYATAGWVDKGIIDTIRSEVAERFPGVPPPKFPGIAPDSFLTYSCLKTQLKFPLPYFDSDEPLVFADRSGSTSTLASFGLRNRDHSSQYELRRQVSVLFVEVNRREYELTAFAIDLCRDSQPHQIVLAVIEPGKSLTETLKAIEQKIQERTKERGNNGITEPEGLGPDDRLMVPNMAFRIAHRFATLEGVIEGDALNGQPIHVALQDLEFRLDRSGAELWSRARVYFAAGPQDYLLDRPFLLYMKKRDAQEPYFVMWIENDELSQKWAE